MYVTFVYNNIWTNIVFSSREGNIFEVAVANIFLEEIFC